MSVVEFEDGTTATFEVRLVISTNSWVDLNSFTLVSLKDENGNEIEYRDGDPRFPDGDLFQVHVETIESFVAAAQRAGIPITSNSYSCSPTVCIVRVTDPQ